MQVMKRTVGIFGNNSYISYTFSKGYEYRVYFCGTEFGYTSKGNYTSQVTTRKLCRIASEYEDRRTQIRD
jgi:hypothetical protein